MNNITITPLTDSDRYNAEFSISKTIADKWKREAMPHFAEEAAAGEYEEDEEFCTWRMTLDSHKQDLLVKCLTAAFETLTEPHAYSNNIEPHQN